MVRLINNFFPVILTIVGVKILNEAKIILGSRSLCEFDSFFLRFTSIFTTWIDLIRNR